jgi:hypothetical protein
MIARFAVGAGLLACVLASAACDPEDPCDKGYRADHGFCWLLDAGNDWYGDPEVDDAGVPKSNPDATFGTECMLQSDCGGDAPVCGGPMLPICTVTNCENTGCPNGWTCIDVTKYMASAPGVTSVCINF